MSREEASEESPTDDLELLQSKIQAETVNMCHHLLSNAAGFRPWMFYLLGVLETIQVLWFSFHNRLTFQGNSLGVPAVKTVLSYLNIDAILESFPSAKTPILIVAFAITVVYVGCFVLLKVALTRHPNPRMLALLLPATNIMVLVYNGLLVMPLTEIIGNVLYCDPSATTDLQCYDATYTLLCVFAVLIALVMLISLSLYILMYYVRNPFDRCFLSLNDNFYVLPKTGIKLAACIYFLIDTSGQYTNVYIYGYAGLMLGYIFLFRLKEHHHRLQFYYFQLSCEVSTVVFSLITIMQFYVSSPGVSELTLVYGSLCAALLCYIVILQRKASMKVKYAMTMEEVNSAAYEELIRHVVQVIEDAREEGQPARLLAIVRAHHSKVCGKETSPDFACGCSAYLDDLKNCIWKDHPEKQLQSSYKFLSHLLKEASKLYSHHNYFRMTETFLLYSRLGCKVKAMLIANEVSEQKPTFREKFELFSLKKQFKVESAREDLFDSNKFLDVNSYLTFSHQFLELEEKVELCVENYLHFWNELLQDAPSLLRLSSLSSKVKELKAEVEVAFEGCNSIFPFTIQASTFYLSYLLATNTSLEGYKRASSILNKLSSEDQQISQPSAMSRCLKNMCVITVGATKGVIGHIINCNSEIRNILGFLRRDIVGQTIYKLMPKSYYELHDSLVEGFISCPDKVISTRNTKFQTLVLDSRGFVRMCLQLIRISPSIEHGFKFISFCELKKEEENVRFSYVVYSEPSMQIQAMSEVDVPNGNTERLPQIMLQSHISFMFPELDFGSLDDAIQHTVIDSRIFSNGITRDEVEMLTFEQSSELGLTAKVMLDRTIVFKDIKLKRLKFFLTQGIGKLGYDKRPSVMKIQSRQELEMMKIQEDVEQSKSYEGMQPLEAKVGELLIHSRLQYRLKMMLGVITVSYLLNLIGVSLHAKNSLDVSMIYTSGFSKLNVMYQMELASSEIALRNLLIAHSSKLNLTDDQFTNYTAQMLADSQQLAAILQRLYQFSEDQYFPATNITVPFGQFATQSGTENIDLPDAVSRVIYAGTVVGQQQQAQFDSYPPINNSLYKQVFSIEANCPERLPKLANKLTSDLTVLLQKRVAHCQQLFNIVLIVVLTGLLLAAIIIVAMSCSLLKCDGQLLQIYNMLTVESVTALKDLSEAYILLHFEQNPNSKASRSKTKQRITAIGIGQPIKFHSESDIEQLADQHAELTGEPKRKSIRPITVHGLTNKFYVLLAFLLAAALPIASQQLEKLIFEPFALYSTNLQLIFDVKQQNLESCLFAEACFIMRQEGFCSSFGSHATMLYAATEAYYLSSKDINGNRAAIYGQIEKLKTLLASNSTQQDIITPVQILLNVEKTLSSQTSAIFQAVNSYVQTTLATIVKAGGIGSCILLLFSYLVVSKLLIKRLENRCIYTENIIATFPVQILRTDQVLVEYIQKLLPPPKKK